MSAVSPLARHVRTGLAIRCIRHAPRRRIRAPDAIRCLAQRIRYNVCAGTLAEGDLLFFDDRELQPDELVLYLIDNLGRDVGRIETTPEHGVLMVPPVMGPVLIEGEDVSDLRFSANAPDWSSARVELVQQQEARRRTVRWVVTSTVGALATTTLPALPSDMTVASIGFDTAASCQARIELQHELVSDAVVRDRPTRPFVGGSSSLGTADALRDLPF